MKESDAPVCRLALVSVLSETPGAVPPSPDVRAESTNIGRDTIPILAS
jgi:hypothetical protein